MQINLVLSGGGARGFAHLGVIKAMNEAGIQIQAISGTSSGAVTGAFIAAGYSPDETLKIMKDYKLLRLLRGAFNAGLFSMSKFEQIFTTCFPHNSFTELSMPLYISSTNIYTGKTECFSKGELVPALLASSSLPVIFKPVHIDGQYYLDGGILNNLPVEPFINGKYPIVAVHVNPVNEIDKVPSALKIMERSLNLAVYANVIERLRFCDFIYEPKLLSAFSVYSYSKADQIFTIGYEYAKQQIHRMSKKLAEI